MKKLKLYFCIALCLAACNNKKEAPAATAPIITKGLYVFGPESKSFTNCLNGKEYWVADSAKSLELAYSSLSFEKPYEPVYIEVECSFVASEEGRAADFDSTMVVTKLLMITKAIPAGPCSD